MSEYIERAETLTLPVVISTGIVAFPGIPVSFELNDTQYGSAVAAERAAADGSYAVLLPELRTAENSEHGDEENDRLSPVGTVAKIKQFLKTPEGTCRVIAEGVARASIKSTRKKEDVTLADLITKVIRVFDKGGIRGEAMMREAIGGLEGMLHYLPSVSGDILRAAKAITNPGMLADFIAANILIRYEDKLAILACFDPMERVELLNTIIQDEVDLLNCEAGIHKKVRERLNRNQREYYLREQIRAIQEELGEGADSDEYMTRILQAKLPDEVRKKLLKENDKLARTPYGSAEANVLSNYLDVCLELPWGKMSKDRTDIAAAKKVLDSDHNGLQKVKERILEYLAVRQRTPELKNQILCLVGPPGVGKTSVAASIARAMKRKYVRVSLGGVRDEADIRGHRKTYIGAMPGRIINAISQAGVCNPLILLDEIDKLTHDAHGDPTSALLEVLDPEQNRYFRDHFIEMPFDLSDCLFIATANTLETVPRPLIDRMEIIELPTYTRTEKCEIAKNHLIPKQLTRHGLNRRTVRITDAAIGEIIDHYTREAGVRNLERAIAAVARKCAKQLVEDPELHRITVDAEDVHTYLGARKRMPETVEAEDQVGLVNGLAWTETGGDMLQVEVAILDGTGKLELTGQLGDVMKESAKAALTYVRAIAVAYGISTDFYQKKDIHIHVPEGAIPKDGPSAGVTMMTALLSALSGIPVRHDVAMTGEITLRGRVLPIGGLKEKALAACAAGVHTVLIPEANRGDMEELDASLRQALNFVLCRNAGDVLQGALVPQKSRVQAPELPTHRNEQILPLHTPIDRTGITVHDSAVQSDHPTC